MQIENWAKKRDQQLNLVALCACLCPFELSEHSPAHSQLSLWKDTHLPQNLGQSKQSRENVSNSAEHLQAAELDCIGTSELIIRWSSSPLITSRCEPVLPMPMSQSQTTGQNRSPGERLFLKRCFFNLCQVDNRNLITRSLRGMGWGRKD